MKAAIFGMIAVAAIVLILLARFFVSPADVFTGKERTVAVQELPNGERIEVVQYWNQGDFYNLDLRHFAKDGEQFECVIDPDCNRLPSCVIELDATLGEATIRGNGKAWARYRWKTKELVRKNGLVIKAD